jgi:large subunit ribosomal protein L5e
MEEDEPEKYQAHFSEYLKRGITADNIEALYKKVHAAIRAEPSAVKATKDAPKEHKRYCALTCFYLKKKQLLLAHFLCKYEGVSKGVKVRF